MAHPCIAEDDRVSRVLLKMVYDHAMAPMMDDFRPAEESLVQVAVMTGLVSRGRDARAKLLTLVTNGLLFTSQTIDNPIVRVGLTEAGRLEVQSW